MASRKVWGFFPKLHSVLVNSVPTVNGTSLLHHRDLLALTGMVGLVFGIHRLRKQHQMVVGASMGL